MDLVDPSEVGKFGTIRLLKQREPTAVVAAYPIDDEEVSFGRDSNCSVRLYYPEVSPLHCKIIFEERKAILQVFGTNGVLVDGCAVYPAKPAALGFAPTTTSVPLPNNSVFEIHKKRFIFNYPPKALRPQLFTPAANRRKSVRMSLVQCAQVFTPAPSPYPRENLRILQSPVKLGGSDAPITLVHTDRPRVYEEEQDLVILEDTDEKANHPPSPTPVRSQAQVAAAPRTPRRSMPSLHRAVLIRSAQRNAIIREESERQKTIIQPQFTQINLDEDAEGEAEEEEEVMNSIMDVSEESEGSSEELTSNVSVNAEAAMNADPFIDRSIIMVEEQDITEVSFHFYLSPSACSLTYLPDTYGDGHRGRHALGPFDLNPYPNRHYSPSRRIYDASTSTSSSGTSARGDRSKAHRPATASSWVHLSRCAGGWACFY